MQRGAKIQEGWFTICPQSDQGYWIQDQVRDDYNKYFSVSPTILYDTGRENYQGQTANALLNMNGKVTMKSLWIAVFLLPLWLTGACETKLPVFYVKARNTEELKIHAFERCGRHYRVLSYEEDTARIECLEKIIEN